jgi:hypothetical protein
MNEIVAIAPTALVALIHAAAGKLAEAETAAEVLDARNIANAAFHHATGAERLARANKAAQEVIAAAYHAQADALAIEAAAKRRLADEYDVAIKTGAAKTQADNQYASSEREQAFSPPEIGLTHKEMHEARRLRDAEAASPGVTARALNKLQDAGATITKAALRREMNAEIPPPRRMPKVIAKPPPPRRYAREKSTPTAHLTAAGTWLLGTLDEFTARGRDESLAAFAVNLSNAQRARMTEAIPLLIHFLNRIDEYLKGETRTEHKEKAP